MTPKEALSLSKFLSKVLRHDPSAAGIALDAHGWAGIDDLIAGARQRGRRILREDLDEVVRTSDKKRFSVTPDGRLIRAAQGHSVAIALDHDPVAPPETLYHGTAERNLAAILAEGLKPGRRLHVHLSPDPETARRVGRRHGPPAILIVAAGRAHADGQRFWRAENGVWLTDPLAPDYLLRMDGGK